MIVALLIERECAETSHAVTGVHGRQEVGWNLFAIAGSAALSITSSDRLITDPFVTDHVIAYDSGNVPGNSIFATPPRGSIHLAWLLEDLTIGIRHSPHGAQREAKNPPQAE